MAFTVDQKINGRIYVYRSEGYWDKEKKQCRHRRVCIGRRDIETGEIIPSRSQIRPRGCLDYGNTYVLNIIAKQTGLLDALKDVFPDIWQKIITCAFYEVSERKPLYLCGQWSECTRTIDNVTLSSQRISELLQYLGKADRERMAFFSKWAQTRSEQEYLAFDITSISSYSKLIEALEYGYNRDGEKLPQVNLGMLFGQTSLLPVFYTLYPGSIRDMSTLKNMITYARQLNSGKVRFVLDKGFYSDTNIREMQENRMKFAISVPFTTKLSGSLAAGAMKNICSPLKSFVIGGDVVYSEVRRIQKNGKKLRAFIYYSERQLLDAKESLLKRIARVEQVLKDKRSISAAGNDSALVFLNIRKSKKGLSIRRNEQKIKNFLKHKGFNIIISNEYRDARDILHLYRSKDSIEKAFNNMKNELDMKRLRIHSDSAMTGRTFICFISLILYAWLDKCMKEKDLYKTFTQEEVMCELKKLKVVELSPDRNILTEVTKTQKRILKAFGIPEPSQTLL